jgi:hypothetical protein
VRDHPLHRYSDNLVFKTSNLSQFVLYPNPAVIYQIIKSSENIGGNIGHCKAQNKIKHHFYVAHWGPKCLIFHYNRRGIRYLNNL